MRRWTVLVTAVAVAASLSAAALHARDQAPGSSGKTKQKGVTTEAPGQERDAEREVRRHLEVLGGRDVQIGVSIRDVEGDQAKAATGAVVTDVRQDGPAAKAGVKDGDVIVEFDGEKVRSAKHLARLVGETAPGRTVTASVLRGGTRVDVQVTAEQGRMAFDLGEGPMAFHLEREPGFSFRGGPDGPSPRWERRGPGRGDDPFDVLITPPGRGRLGIGIQDLTPQLAEYFGTTDGVLVTSVQQDSAAGKAGLRAGDVITAVGDTKVTSPSELTRAVREAEGAELRITYTRDKKSATATAKIESRERQASPARPI